jgi:hypothetical protein
VFDCDTPTLGNQSIPEAWRVGRGENSARACAETCVGIVEDIDDYQAFEAAMHRGSETPRAARSQLAENGRRVRRSIRPVQSRERRSRIKYAHDYCFYILPLKELDLLQTIRDRVLSRPADTTSETSDQ